MLGWFRRSKTRKSDSLVPCPHCSGDIRSDATFCRHCGSSQADGWSDEPYDNEGYGDEDEFDYDQFVEDNFSQSRTSTTLSPLWRAVAIMIVVAFVVSVFVQLI